MKNLDKIFVAALKKLLKSWGTQSKLAETVGVTREHIGAILGGTRYGSEELRHRIAHTLGFADYEEFLDVGRAALGLPLVRNKKIESIPATHLDHGLMIDVVVTLEEFLTEQKKWLNPKNKAEIIVQLYELMKEEEEVEGMGKLKLVAPILSKALSLAVDEPLQKVG